MAIRLPNIRINKTWLMLLVAIGLALVATFLTTTYLKRREISIADELAKKSQQGGAKVAVVVPTRDLPAGTPVDENIVASRNVVEDLVYPDAILASDFDKYKGQSLLRPVLKGRPLLKPDLRPIFADFAGTLTPGTRAITVDVDELNSVAHMIQPGNRIDLMLVMRRDDGGQTVVPFMDRMKVLAAGQKVAAEGADESAPGTRKNFSYSNLTLEVTPPQAARLTLAQDLGKLRFTLRNEKDEKSEDFNVNAQNIFDEISARAKQQKRGTPTGMVEFIVGGQRSGPSAKSVDVAAPVAVPGALLVPPIAPAKAVAPNNASAPAGPGGYDANGLTPEMKADLKSLLDKQ
ncbi:MAG: Flp pilus assembly protein CpaB [Proteobacteria bacterium]|nr:Flp pilus assembly protein CpaB [Pseudomonadota bacterium]HQR04061.1 Flp pilus assembly protein CpaB [Rhodocyclaceae bacterium]